MDMERTPVADADHAHLTRRWSLWLHWCEHAAVLPWVDQVLHLAQAAEEADTWRSTVCTRARLLEQWAQLDVDLQALDAAWYQEVIAARGIGPRVRHARKEGRPDEHL